MTTNDEKPSPSPVSAPSPAGGVREAIAQIIDPHSFVPYEPTGAADDAVFADMVKSSLDDAYRKADRILALSSPATPELVSAPANGEVVDQAEIKRISDWLLERNHDHLLAAQENRITMMRVRSDTEMFLDAAILLSKLAALSNPAPGHGEGGL